MYTYNTIVVGVITLSVHINYNQVYIVNNIVLRFSWSEWSSFIEKLGVLTRYVYN